MAVLLSYISARFVHHTKVTLKSENNFREKRLWVQIFPSRCDFWCTTGHKSSNPQLQTLLVNNKECETQDQIREGWADHFQRLASPLENTRFEKEYKQMMDLDMEAIEILCREESSPMDPVTEAEVDSALKRKNNNKVADIIGLTSEHQKLAGIETIPGHLGP